MELVNHYELTTYKTHLDQLVAKRYSTNIVAL